MEKQIKNIKKAAERIKKAIKSQERIILYGDADMDGIGSTIVLEEAIQVLGGKTAAIYFPDREIEGYGLNEDALKFLKKHAPALLILMDCGIGNLDEVKIANKMGFEVIIIDHHKILHKLPQASIIVNPNQKGDRYPFKEFAAAGVVFKLIEILLAKKMTVSLRNNLLEIVALATISDMMPQINDNLKIIEDGLQSLKNTHRPAFLVFREEEPIVSDNINQFVQKLIFACSAGSGKKHSNEAYLLLTAKSVQEAESLAKYLLEKAYDRRLQIKEVVEEIEKKISQKREETIIFEGEDWWPVLMLGPAASRICRSHKKPVFLHNQKNGICQGAVRTPQGMDGVKAMMQCSKILETYGGHKQAAGFRIKEKDLPAFKECLIKYFKNKC
ncbi:MAG: DHH family phosphoesterase [Candidatus Nealsonbacteria bacterium]